ncbi:MAG: sensor histidine kinase [Pseudomonadota bacterium]
MLKRLHQFLLPSETGERWMPYLWLIYLVFFCIDWYFRTFTALEVALAALTLVAFLALYFSAYRRHGLAAFVHIVAIMALAVAWTPSNNGAAVLYIFAASFAYRVGDLKLAFGIVLGIVAVAALMSPFTYPSVFFLMPAGVMSLIIGSANIAFAQNERKNAELRMTQAEVRRLARVAERERIARDLHDVLGHTLSLIAVKSELAGRLIEQQPRQAAAEMEAVQSTARNALAEVRQAISGMNEMSLAEALEQARVALRSVGVQFEPDVDTSLALPPETEAMLSLVIREAVTNIIRHADARTCRIRLYKDAPSGQFRLEIIDDGRGTIRPDGNGIQGMRARIESINGRLSIPSERSGGHLIADIPAVVT